MLKVINAFLFVILFSGCFTYQVLIPIQECKHNFAVLYDCNDFDTKEFDNVMYMLKKANATIVKILFCIQ